MLRFKPTLLMLTAVAVSVGCTGEGQQAEQPVVKNQMESARMVGMYQYMADAGLFTDCVTGVRVPVAMEADNAALERAYLGAQDEPGQEMLVSVTGRVDQRPPMEGEGTLEHLIVERFEQVWPTESCEKSTVETPLQNTYWKLVELNGGRVETHPDQREVHILFRANEKRLTGFAGCNQMTGSYEAGGDSLSFGLLATTMMACPHLDEETTFLGALEGVTRFLILGESLVLSSESADIARLRAVYFE